MQGGKEGGKKINNRAYREYQESIEKSMFIQLAQKLAQHLNNLTQDISSRVRWIWELIQNAKDVPNEFNKCKIRIQLYDDKLIFFHNGDPFRVSDLRSLVAQYSSKPEENKTHSETTGKYGTGFITTYILSRKVRIKGLLTIVTAQEQTKKVEEEPENEDVIAEDQFQTAKGTTKGQNVEENFYQKFEIFLDRTYRDRDRQLCMKLMRTEQSLKEDLLQNEPKPKWQRKQNQFNTQFIYQELDNAAHQMIEEAMINLKELFVYALLFNPKLSELSVVNKTGGKRIRNFKISRCQTQKICGVQIFHAKLQEEEKGNSVFSAAFMEDRGSSSIIAVPVEIYDKEKIRLLETKSQFPKMFKDFPLIGSKDHGFNFIFSSRRFYPNETRSDLLLKKIEGRPNPKSQSNWEALNGIFTKGLQLYIKLSDIISQGQQNLLIVALENQFTNGQFEGTLSKLFEIYQEKMMTIQYIEYKNKKTGSLNGLVLPKDASEKRTLKDMAYSSELNRIFSMILGEHQTLSDENHKRFYEKLQKYSKIWSKASIQYVNVHDCLKIFADKGYKGLQSHCGTQDLVLDFISQIYEFLSEHNPSLMTQGVGNKFAFVLTNERVFRNINEEVNKQRIVAKENLPLAYEEIGEKLGIRISGYTIYDAFAEHFKNVKKFNLDSMFELYRNVLNVPYAANNNKENEKKIIQLGSFLMTFKIECNCMELISKFRVFHNQMAPFQRSDGHNLELTKEDRSTYTALFTSKCMTYVNEMTTQHPDLKRFKALTILDNSETDEETLDFLSQIYEFISEHKPSLMTQGVENQSDFVLTNERAFRNINKVVNGQRIVAKENLPLAYEEIGEKLGIRISGYTIYDAFAEHFKKVKKFNLDSMFELYRNILNVPYAANNNKENEKKILQLGSFLMTFNVECNCMELISKFRVFHNQMAPFQRSNTHNLEITKEDRSTYTTLFVFKCMRYINEMTTQNPDLKRLKVLTIFDEQEQLLEWWNQILSYEQNRIKGKDIYNNPNIMRLCYEQSPNRTDFLDLQLTMTEKFRKMSELFYFASKKGEDMVRIDPPNERDIKFYEHIRHLWNRYHDEKERNRVLKYNQNYSNPMYHIFSSFVAKEPLSQRLVHEKVKEKISKPMTYESQFKMAVQLYNKEDISEEEKVYILNYVFELRDQQAIKGQKCESKGEKGETKDSQDLTQKLKIFVELEKKAHYDYPKYSHCVKKFNQQLYTFSFVKNPEQIEAAMELKEKYGSLPNAMDQIKRLEKLLKQKM